MKCRVFDRDVASQCLNGVAWEERLGEGGFTHGHPGKRDTPRFHVTCQNMSKHIPDTLPKAISSHTPQSGCDSEMISGNNQIAVGQSNSVKLCDTVDSCLGSTSAMETHSAEKLQLRSRAIAEI